MKVLIYLSEEKKLIFGESAPIFFSSCQSRPFIGNLSELICKYVSITQEEEIKLKEFQEFMKQSSKVRFFVYPLTTDWCITID